MRPVCCIPWQAQLYLESTIWLNNEIRSQQRPLTIHTPIQPNTQCLIGGKIIPVQRECRVGKVIHCWCRNIVCSHKPNSRITLGTYDDCHTTFETIDRST